MVQKRVLEKVEINKKYIKTLSKRIKDGLFFKMFT